MRRLLLISLLFAPSFAGKTFAAETNYLARGLAIHAGSLLRPLKARLYAADLPAYKDVLILNPGGEIPALAMSGLAEAFARAGSFVYVLENSGNLPILSSNLAMNLASALQSNLDSIDSIPSVVRALQTSDLPFRVLGHSLGGAVLGEETGNASSIFQNIILIGVSRLVKTPKTPQVKVTMLLGENDGLAPREGVDQLSEFYKTGTIILPGVNHFCIISDASVGAADKRAQDHPTDLSSEECAARVVSAVTDGA